MTPPPAVTTSGNTEQAEHLSYGCTTRDPSPPYGLRPSQAYGPGENPTIKCIIEPDQGFTPTLEQVTVAAADGAGQARDIYNKTKDVNPDCRTLPGADKGSVLFQVDDSAFHGYDGKVEHARAHARANTHTHTHTNIHKHTHTCPRRSR